MQIISTILTSRASQGTPKRKNSAEEKEYFARGCSDYFGMTKPPKASDGLLPSPTLRWTPFGHSRHVGPSHLML